MPNTSATGGPLAPSASPAPLEGQALLDFIQDLVVGITGLDGTVVRPRWQPEPPNVPSGGTAWAAIGVTSRTADTYPYVTHDSVNDVDAMQRHEILNVLCSFYDTGAGGQADAYAALLRDGIAIGQNREKLFLAGMGLVDVGELMAVPSLLKQRWLYRVDLPLVIRRQIDRTYPVLTILTGEATLNTDDGFTESIQVEE